MIPLIRIDSNKIEILKIAAIILMILDHIATFIPDNLLLLKMLGRATYPLFAFILVYNYIHNTKNKINYIKRIFLFGIIIEPVHQYSLGFNYNHFTLNIFFTLAAGLFLLFLIEKSAVHKMAIRVLLISFILIVTLPLSYYLTYSLPGVIVIIAFYLYIINDAKIPYFILLYLSIILLNANWSIVYSHFGLLSLLLIFILNKFNFSFSIRLNKWFYYLFYPVHLIFLKILF